MAITMMLSCNKKECPGIKYSLSISLGNYTGNEIEVKLFPRPEFMSGGGYYYPSSTSSGSRSTEFTMNEDSVSVWSYKHNIFTTNDTAVTPSYLISRVFDSIYFLIADSANTMVKLYPDQTINYSQNPFQKDSIWQFFRGKVYYSDNDCENPMEIKRYKFYIDPDFILP